MSSVDLDAIGATIAEHEPNPTIFQGIRCSCYEVPDFDDGAGYIDHLIGVLRGDS